MKGLTVLRFSISGRYSNMFFFQFIAHYVCDMFNVCLICILCICILMNGIRINLKQISKVFQCQLFFVLELVIIKYCIGNVFL